MAILGVAALLVVAVCAAYYNSFAGAFVFDDVPSIAENASIRRLWPLSNVLWPDQAGGLTTSGRPLVNLSFALNYAISGSAVGGYHATNLAIHCLATLALFGLVRRTVEGGLKNQFDGRTALLFAGVVALWWGVHPIQTESVTYMVQRAESLAGGFYLLTLYAFVRALAVGPNGARAVRCWLTLSVLACVAAMACKEVAVSAPLVILLYDRTFGARTFGEAWRLRRGYYLALSGTWLVLTVLVLGTAGRGGTVSTSGGISTWHYLLTQCSAIPGYLARAVWPHPLIFDYGIATIREVSAVWLPGLLLLVLLVGTIVALVWSPVLGFLGFCFWALLAPSSSFVPVVTQTAAEHRMYLPLAVVVVLAMTVVFRWLREWAAVLGVIIAIPLGWATVARNADYRTEATIWADTVTKLPTNARAHNNLGQALYREGKFETAIAAYERALALQPEYPEPHYNLGVASAARGQWRIAIDHYEAALRAQPVYPEAENNLANALVALGQVEVALPHYAAALKAKPAFAEAENNLGNALLQLRQPTDAEGHFRRALSLRPGYSEACYNLGNARAAQNDMTDALGWYRRALTLQPEYAEAYVNAGNALLQLNRMQEAITAYEAALRLEPHIVAAHLNLGLLLIDTGRVGDAIVHLRAVIERQPDTAQAWRALAFAQEKSGAWTDAVASYQAYLRLVPGDADAQAEWRRLLAEKH